MRTFNCACGELTFSDNVAGVVCGRELGFLPDVLSLSTPDPAENGMFKASGANEGRQLTKNARITRRNPFVTG